LGTQEKVEEKIKGEASHCRGSHRLGNKRRAARGQKVRGEEISRKYKKGRQESN